MEQCVTELDVWDEWQFVENRHNKAKWRVFEEEPIEAGVLRVRWNSFEQDRKEIRDLEQVEFLNSILQVLLEVGQSLVRANIADLVQEEGSILTQHGSIEDVHCVSGLQETTIEVIEDSMIEEEDTKGERTTLLVLGFLRKSVQEETSCKDHSINEESDWRELIWNS